MPKRLDAIDCDHFIANKQTLALLGEAATAKGCDKGWLSGCAAQHYVHKVGALGLEEAYQACARYRGKKFSQVPLLSLETYLVVHHTFGTAS